MGVYTQLLVRRYLTTRIIPLIAVGAVALCVALVIVVVSVMTGFLDTLRSSGKTLMGDVVINYPIQGIGHYQDLIADLQTRPEVEAATPLVDTLGLLRMPYPEGPIKEIVQAHVWAIEPESFARVTGLNDTIYWKRPKDQAAADAMRKDDPRLTVNPSWEAAAKTMKDPETGTPGAILGIHVSIVYQRQADGSYRMRPDAAERWWMPLNDVTLTLVPISERGTISTTNSRVFRVVNEMMSGVFQVDKNRVFIPLADGQEMLRLDAADIYDLTQEPDAQGNYPVRGRSPAKATQILVRAKPNITPDQLKACVLATYKQFYAQKAADKSVLVKPPQPPSPEGGVSIMTWEQRLHDLIGPVEKERQMMRILFSITYLVCAGLILAIFWSIVSEKTRDIGILRAIGASRAGVLWIFLRYGLVVGVAGSALGTLLGWIVVKRINDIHGAMGHDAPRWLWMTCYVLAGCTALFTLRSLIRQHALASLMWAIATVAVAGVATGLMLHRGFLVWDPAVYYFARIPSQVDWWSALGTCTGAIVFSVLGAAVPAARAADIDPVRALRYE